MIKRIAVSMLLAGTCMPFISDAETFDTCTRFIDSVPTTISTQGVYCLRKDVATSQTYGSGIMVTANNVTIDCNGYKIGGLAAGPGTGAIGIQANDRHNVTVRNCNVRGFRTGVALYGPDSTGHLVEDNVFNRNTTYGISVTSDRSLIRDNRVLATGGSGEAASFAIDAGRNTDVRDNTIDGVFGTGGKDTSVIGIRFNSGQGTSASNNTVRNLVPSGTGSAFGVLVLSSSQKIFLGNNRVSLPASVADSVGYQCITLNAAVRDSSSWGFEIPTLGCHDSGGNALY